MSHKDEYLANVDTLNKAILLLPDDNKNKKFYSDYVESMAKACKDEDKLDENKWVFLEMISNAAMRQAVYAVFDLGLITENFESEFRSRRPISEINEEWANIAKGLTEEKEAIDKQIAAFKAKEDDLGKFQSVATGRSKSFAEAEKKAQEYASKAAAGGQEA